jgi:FAD/FMN-containing dehydrogenase
MPGNTHLEPSNGDVASFSRRMRGRLIRPADTEYEAARRVWNGMIDRYPALIAQVVDENDVAVAIKFGRRHGMLIAVRGGGHGVAGNAVCDSGLVIDLSGMTAIEVDPAGRTASAEGGVKWGGLDAATQAHGLATTGGLISTTGIAGLTLGGGIGWLMRKFGLTSDNVVRLHMVTADGRSVVADPEREPDLFWALRGGGGRFGAVTRIEYRLHPVDTVFAGMVMYRAERAADVLALWKGLCDDAPDELTTVASFLRAPPAPFVPESLQGQPVVAIVGCHVGDVAAGAEALSQLRGFGPPEVDLFGPMPYLALQSMLDEGAPFGIRAYWKSGYLRDLGPKEIETIVSHSAAAPSPFTQVHLHQMGGAVSRKVAGSTAFGHRDAAYLLNIAGGWAEASDDAANIAWTRAFWSAIRPATDGAYVNFLGGDDGPLLREAYEPEALARLEAIRAAWDPDGVFSTL